MVGLAAKAQRGEARLENFLAASVVGRARSARDELARQVQGRRTGQGRSSSGRARPAYGAVKEFGIDFQLDEVAAHSALGFSIGRLGIDTGRR